MTDNKPKGNPDFLDELIQERTVKDPTFPHKVEVALQERRQAKITVFKCDVCRKTHHSSDYSQVDGKPIYPDTLELVVGSGPSSENKLRCTDKCGQFLTPDQQLLQWQQGQPECPNTKDECCPDFACCQPKLRWDRQKRDKFVQAGAGERTKMMMGALGDLLAAHHDKKIHITRGDPTDDQ